MNTSASSQLEAIQEMMASGHRSVRMERHTLLLWGLAGAILIFTVNAFFTPDRFPTVAMRSIYAHAFLIVPVLLIIGIIDFRMTRSARRKRDESISFVQMQVTKVWWMLIGLIVLINFGMNFFGGGFLFYGVTLAIMGVAFFINGLFSQQMLSWIGSLLILLGLSMVLLQLPLALQEWIAIGVLGLGFPALAFSLDKAAFHATLGRRVLFSIFWLLLALLPAHGVFFHQSKDINPELTAIDLKTYLQQKTPVIETQVVRLPVGTKIPVHIDLSGDVLTSSETAVIELTLKQPLDLAITNGELDGRFKFGKLHWRNNLRNMMRRERTMKTSIVPEQGPRIEIKTELNLQK